MTTIIKIIILHLLLLATQALYMYLSNKALLMKNRYLYLLIMPVIILFPILLNHKAAYSYDLYEYAIVVCIITAAVADVSCAAFNKEYMTEEKIRSLHYAYFLICTSAAFIGGAGNSITAICAAVLTALLLFQVSVRKHSAAEFVKSLPIAAFSLVCSWALFRFIF